MQQRVSEGDGPEEIWQKAVVRSAAIPAEGEARAPRAISRKSWVRERGSHIGRRIGAAEENLLTAIVQFAHADIEQQYIESLRANGLTPVKMA